MEPIEEGLFLGAAVLVFCLAVACLFREQKLMMELGEHVYQNYHQEALIEEIWYE